MCTFKVAIFMSLVLFHCLGRFHSVCPFEGHNLGFQTFFYSDILPACRPNPNLEGQSAVFITPGAQWPIYTPRHRVPILDAFYDLHGLHWDCSFPQSPHGEVYCLSGYNVLITALHAPTGYRTSAVCSLSCA